MSEHVDTRWGARRARRRGPAELTLPLALALSVTAGCIESFSLRDAAVDAADVADATDDAAPPDVADVIEDVCDAGQGCSGAACDVVVATHVVGRAPRNVAVDSVGNAWVTNSGSDTVTRLSPDGGVLVTVPGFSHPFGVAVAGDGSAWVANFGGDSVTHLSAAGARLTTVPTGHQPAQVSIDAAGNVWVANFGGNSLTKIGPTGATRRTFSGVSTPQLIAFDAAGDAWVGSQFTTYVYEFSPSGALLRAVHTGHLQNLGHAFDPDGNLWVTNASGASITRLDPSTGDVLGVYPSGGSGPYAMAFDRHGDLWVGTEANVTRICGTAACGAVGEILGTYRAGPNVTSVAIDPEGNVWAANNGCDTVTELLGAAR